MPVAFHPTRRVARDRRSGPAPRDRRGAADRDGVMIDEATARMARSLLASAEQIAQRKTKTDGG